jgi:hypothetical protein
MHSTQLDRPSSHARWDRQRASSSRSTSTVSCSPTAASAAPSVTDHSGLNPLERMQSNLKRTTFLPSDGLSVHVKNAAVEAYGR